MVNTNSDKFELESTLTLDSALFVLQTMIRIREFEESLATLVEQGEVRTPTHLYTGQEAIAASVCQNLVTSDYVWGGHRSHGHYLAKGGSMNALMAEIMGRATGCSGGRGGSMHIMQKDIGILGTVPIVAATVPLAVGSGFSQKMKKNKGVTVAFFGDGAMEEGHISEAMNIAILYKLPVIFVCENNMYSSHLRMSERRSVGSLVEIATSLGIEGKRLDGNDFEDIFWGANNAVIKARSGLGPTFLECLTYRWRGHVGASLDMDVGVKRRDELGHWMQLDPITKAKDRLIQMGVDDKSFRQLEDQAKAEVADSIEFARNSPHPDRSTLLNFFLPLHL